MTTYLGKGCSFGLPRVPFVNCGRFMYLVISLLVLRAYLFTLSCTGMYELMTVTVSGCAVVSQRISGLHGRDLHWLSSISRQAGPPNYNTRSVKCYAPVICNHVSYGPEEKRGF